MTASTAPRPAVQAVMDQQSAAMRDARALQEAIAGRAGQVQEPVVWTPRLRRVMATLARLDPADPRSLCQHLSGPGATSHWVAWRGGKLRCGACTVAAFAAVHGTREDRRCDGCRRVRSVIHTASVLIRAKVIADELEGPVSARGPVIAHFGTCPDCTAELRAEPPA